jgi:hypothetical protein
MKIDDSVYGIDETGIFRIKIELRRVPEADVQKIPSETAGSWATISPPATTHMLQDRAWDAELRDSGLSFQACLNPISKY